MNIFESEADHFEREMRWIALEEDNPDVYHRKMIDLMCETLEKFGCYEGVKIFKDAMGDANEY